MKDLKKFVNELPNLKDSHVLSIEEQEMVEGGACEGVSCRNSCEPGRKKNTEIKDNDIIVDKEIQERELS